MNVNQKIEAKKAELEQKEKKRDNKGKYRKLTIVERCGKWTIGWVIFWSITAGASWTYAGCHIGDLTGTRTVIIEVTHAQTTTDTQNEAKTPQRAESESKEAEFTAYNAEEGQTDADPTTMASGKQVYEGAIANNCLDFGTKVKVNGKIKVVEDRMNSRYDCDHFDIYMQDHDAAMNFGRQQLEYEVIK